MDIMSEIFLELKNDIKSSKAKPVLLELYTKNLAELKKRNINFSLLDTCIEIYDTDLTHTNKTNVIYIEAKLGEPTQILNAFLENTAESLKNKLGIDSLIKAGVYFATLGIGELLSENLIKNISSMVDDSIEKLPDIFDSEWVNKQIQEKPASAINNTIEDLGNSKTEKLNEKHQLGTNLFISRQAKTKLLELAQNISSYHTPHQAMEFTLKLLTILSINAPKIIIINNPYNLDSASLSLLSLLFSFLKDKKIEDKNVALSVLFSYNELQPHNSFLENHKMSDVHHKISRFRLMVQRYGMLVKPRAKVPPPVITKSTFVGRRAELLELSKSHKSFLELTQSTTSLTKLTQWFVIKGEPGTGKTSLINEYLKQKLQSGIGSNRNQIQLKLLNQVGHSSKITGLASLLVSIEEESQRLTQQYQANRSFFSNWFNDKKVAFNDARSNVNKTVLTNDDKLTLNKAALLKVISSATNLTGEVLSIGTPIKAAISAFQTLGFDRHKAQTKISSEKENQLTQKSEQFEQLNLAIMHLLNIAQVVNDKTKPLPIQLYIDDIQWIDELSAEFILQHLVKNHHVEFLITARGSDSATNFKLAQKNPLENEFKIQVFNEANIIQPKLVKGIDEGAGDRKKVIVLHGIDQRTLSFLIKKTFIDASELESNVISEAIVKALLPAEKVFNSNSEVVTLFAIEALNLISTPLFYKKNKLPLLIIEKSKGKYGVNSIEPSKLSSTVKLIFEYISETHKSSFLNEIFEQSEGSYFTLPSYAIMEERLLIISYYFESYSDATLFSLQLSALTGAPFDSELVKSIIIGLTNLDTDNEFTELKLLKSYLNRQTGQSLSTEHLEILEETFEIIKRIPHTKLYDYKHSLFGMFLYTKMLRSLTENNLLKVTELNEIKKKYKQGITKDEEYKNRILLGAGNSDEKLKIITDKFEKKKLDLDKPLEQFTVFLLKICSACINNLELNAGSSLDKNQVKSMKRGMIKSSEKIIRFARRYSSSDWNEDYFDLQNHIASNLCMSGLSRFGTLNSLVRLEFLLRYMYKSNPRRWAGRYSAVLYNIAIAHHLNDNDEGLEEYSIKVHELVTHHYAQNPKVWASGLIVICEKMALYFRHPEKKDYVRSNEELKQKAAELEVQADSIRISCNYDYNMVKYWSDEENNPFQEGLFGVSYMVATFNFEDLEHIKREKKILGNEFRLETNNYIRFRDFIRYLADGIKLIKIYVYREMYIDIKELINRVIGFHDLLVEEPKIPYEINNKLKNKLCGELKRIESILRENNMTSCVEALKEITHHYPEY